MSVQWLIKQSECVHLVYIQMYMYTYRIHSKPLVMSGHSTAKYYSLIEFWSDNGRN